MKRVKHIVIDGRHITDRMDGLGRYVYEFINHLDFDPSVTKVTVLTDVRYQMSGRITNQTINIFSINVSTGSLSQQWKVPRILKDLKADVYYYPFIDPPIFSPARVNIFSVHDLNHYFFSKYAATDRWFAIFMAKILINLAMFRYQKVIVFSDYVKEQILSTFKLRRAKPVRIYHGMDKLKFDRRTNVEVPMPYLLYVGNNRPHKNIERMLEAFQSVSISNPEINFVICGNFSNRFSNIYSLIEKLGICKRVKLIEGADDTQLAYLYAGAIGVINASVSEGFGFPILEAWSFNKPIAISNASCFPEIAGEGAVYFDPFSVQSISKSLKLLLDDDRLRLRISQKASEILPQFTWNKSAESHMKLFLES